MTTTDPTERETMTTTDPIELGQRAHEQLEKLRTRATELESEAQGLAKAFEQEPSPDALIRSQVAAQQARNARRQAEDFEASEDFLRPVTAAQRARDLARLAELRELMPYQERVDAAAERAARIFGEFIGGLEAELNALRRHLDARNDCVGEYNRLEASLGDGITAGRVLLADVVEQISVRVHRDHGSVTSTPFMDDPRRASIRHNPFPGSSDPYVDVHLRFPCETTRETVG